MEHFYHNIEGWSSEGEQGVIQAVDEVFKNKVNVVGGQQWWVKISIN